MTWAFRLLVLFAGVLFASLLLRWEMPIPAAPSPALPSAPALAPANDPPAQPAQPAHPAPGGLTEVWRRLRDGRNLTNKKHSEGKFYSQVGQDRWVDDVLRHARNGFVVESGACDGDAHSNSAFFEVSRGWECLLVEPNPALVKAILAKGRRCLVFDGGLSPTQSATSFTFKPAGFLGGFTELMSEQHKQRIKREGGGGVEIQVPAFPLAEILRAVNRSSVDYWSLDTEGSEGAILEATDFRSLEVGVMTVEHNGEPGPRQRIRRRLLQQGFALAKEGGQDDFFVNPAYLAQRGLQR